MAIADTDVKIRYSVAAAAGNTTAGTAAGSLGDQISTTDVPDTGSNLQAVFASVDADDAADGATFYACVFVLNDHATLTLQGTTIEIEDQATGGGTVTMGLDTTAVSAKGSASAQAVTVADNQTAPAGVSFSAGPLTIGDLTAGQTKAVWLKLVVAAATTAQADDVDLLVAGQSEP